MRRKRQLAIVALLAAAPFAGACGQPTAEIPMPAALMGRWTTTDTDYADRYFQLTSRDLVLGTGGRTSERYRVSRTLHARDNEGDLYTVEYADSRGGDYKMSLYLDPAGGGSVRFKNQPRIIWRKAPS